MSTDVNLQHKRVNMCEKGKYWEATLQSVSTTVSAVEYLSLHFVLYDLYKGSF